MQTCRVKTGIPSCKSWSNLEAAWRPARLGGGAGPGEWRRGSGAGAGV